MRTRNRSVWIVLATVASLSLLLAYSTMADKSQLGLFLALAVATSLFTGIVVYSIDQLTHPVPPRVEMAWGVSLIHGHENLYRAYQVALEGLGEGSHTVIATSSSPQKLDIRQRWDSFLKGFLAAHQEVDYRRIIIQNGSPEWRARLKEIGTRYRGVKNYTDVVTTGPPSIDLLLIDADQAFLTFASTSGHQESTGLLVRIPETCKKLQGYAMFQLDAQLAPSRNFVKLNGRAPP